MCYLLLAIIFLPLVLLGRNYKGPAQLTLSLAFVCVLTVSIVTSIY